MHNYETIRYIGSGSFGKVDLVKNIREGREFVVKRIMTRDLSDKDRENIKNEVGILQKLRHPNIVAYKDCFIEEDSFNIIMSYCEGGDMYNKIRNNDNKLFSEDVTGDHPDGPRLVRTAGLRAALPARPEDLAQRLKNSEHFSQEEETYIRRLRNCEGAGQHERLRKYRKQSLTSLSAPLTTCRPSSSSTNRTPTSRTSGPWVASCTRSAISSTPSMLKI